MKNKFIAFGACVFFAGACSVLGQSTDKQTQKAGDPQPACEMMQDAHSQMNARGENGMGFSQNATTHHFFLTANGGVIQVKVKDASDAANRYSIRMHLTHIAQAFAKGDFDIPMFVHDTTPPGVPEMKRLQKEIRYSFEELPGGGRVVIVSENKTAVEAIHSFMRFQIAEHKTGDSTDVTQNIR